VPATKRAQLKAGSSSDSQSQQGFSWGEAPLMGMKRGITYEEGFLYDRCRSIGRSHHRGSHRPVKHPGFYGESSGYLGMVSTRAQSARRVQGAELNLLGLHSVLAMENWLPPVDEVRGGAMRRQSSCYVRRCVHDGTALAVGLVAFFHRPLWPVPFQNSQAASNSCSSARWYPFPTVSRRYRVQGLCKSPAWTV
jgi:hypothetical protein